MSDFLRQLATRSRQADPAIRPRLAGLFEPQQPAGSGLFPGTPTTAIRATPGEFAQDRETFGPSVAPPAARVQFAATIAAHDQPESVPASATPRAASGGAQSLAPSAQPAVPARAPVAGQPPAAAIMPDLSRPRPPAQRAPDSGHVAPPADVHAATRSVTPPTVEPPRSAPPTARQQTPAGEPISRPQPFVAEPDAANQRHHTEVTVKTPAHALAPPTRPVTPASPVSVRSTPDTPSTPLTRQTAPRQAILAQPQVRPLPVPTPAPRPRELQREAAPSIQVTIGRVEVRAVPAETPARPARPAPPTLSLEEYLRQRNGGRR